MNKKAHKSFQPLQIYIYLNILVQLLWRTVKKYKIALAKSFQCLKNFVISCWPRSPLCWHRKDTVHFYAVRKSVVSIALLLFRKANYHFLKSTEYYNSYWLSSNSWKSIYIRQITATESHKAPYVLKKTSLEIFKLTVFPTSTLV